MAGQKNDIEERLKSAHPNSVIERWVLKLPPRLRILARLLSVATAWIAVVSGSVSILRDLRWIVDASVAMYRALAALRPTLNAIAEAVHWIATWWRELTHPVYEFFFGWWPIAVPPMFLDVIVVGSILFGGYIRRELHLHSEFTRIARSARGDMPDMPGSISQYRKDIRSLYDKGLIEIHDGAGRSIVRMSRVILFRAAFVAGVLLICLVVDFFYRPR